MRSSSRAFAASLVGLASSLASLPALTLGLGDITLHSALNETLDASIELLELDGLDASQLTIGLASPGEFSRADLDFADFLGQIEFSVEVHSPGRGILRVRSRAPVVEPYLDLLVDARWPSGRLLGEYTLLFDPPMVREPAASATQAARREPNSAAALPAPMGALPAPPAASAGLLAQDASGRAAGSAAPPMSGGPQGAGSELRVQANDTLWQIAAAVRPDPGISVQQMMLAILRANPQAFLDGNINHLLSDSLLRIPALEEVRSLSHAQALEQVGEQNQRFGLPGLDAEPLAAGGARAAAGLAPRRDELSVLNGNAGTAGTAAGQGRAAGRAAELERELLLSEESLERANLENAELQARVIELEAQLGTLQSIIDVQDERYVRLQAELARLREQAAQASAPRGVAPEQTASLMTAVQDWLARLNRLWAEQPLVLGGALLALVLAAIGLLVKRRLRAEEEEEDEEQPVPGQRSATLRKAAAPSEQAARAAPAAAQVEESLAALPEESGPVTLEPPSAEEPATLSDAAELRALELEPLLAAGAEPLDNGSFDLAGLNYPEPADPYEALNVQGPFLEVPAQGGNPLAAPSLTLSRQERPYSAGYRQQGSATDAAAPGESGAFDLDLAFSSPAAGRSAPLKKEQDPFELAGLDLMFNQDGDDDAAQALFERDEAASKLDLAVAYEAMGDLQGALRILGEVLESGSESQTREARALMDSWKTRVGD